MPRVVHFEIHADQPQRCADFYEQLFGWSSDKFGALDYWIVTTGTPDEPGIDGAILPRRGGAGDKVVAFVCTIDVPNIDEFTSKAKSVGGTEVVAKNEVPGVGWTAYFKDTEGNIFGMFQPLGRQ